MNYEYGWLSVEGLSDDTKQHREVNDFCPAPLHPSVWATFVTVLMGL